MLKIEVIKIAAVIIEYFSLQVVHDLSVS